MVLNQQNTCSLLSFLGSQIAQGHLFDDHVERGEGGGGGEHAETKSVARGLGTMRRLLRERRNRGDGGKT